MHPEKSIKETNEDDAPNRQQMVRRWSSGLIVGFIAFIVPYAILASNYERWGAKFGWLPSSAIAAPFGWLGHTFPWIGDAVAFLWDLLSLLAMFI